MEQLSRLPGQADKNATQRPVNVFWWLVVWFVGAFLRFYDLGGALLSPQEASTAISALQGAEVTGTATSGLLVGIMRIIFWIIGPDEWSARLLPALLGSLLPLTAALYARYLGKRGALIAAGLLAISPSALYFSRNVSGTIIGLTAALFVTGAYLRYLERPERRWLLACGAGIGAGLAAGSSFMSIMAVIFLAAMLSHWREVKQGCRALMDRRLLIAALAVAVLGSTAFLFFPEGLGISADGFVYWLEGFGLDLSTVARPSGIVLIYELPALVFGAIGAGWAVRRGGGFHRFLVRWTLLGLGVGLLRSDQLDAPFMILVPLVFVAAAFLSEIVDNLPEWRYSSTLKVTITILSIFGVQLFVNLGQYARYATMNANRASASLMLVGISVIMGAGVVALVWTYDKRVAANGLLLSLALLLVVYGWGKAWELGHTHSSDPREWWVQEAAAPGAEVLLDTLTTTLERAPRSRLDLSVTVQTEIVDPFLRWHLRDFTDVTWIRSLEPSIVSDVVITPAEQQSPLLGENYVGMDLALQLDTPIPPEEAQSGDLWRWLLLRDAPPPIHSHRIIVWLRQDVARLE